MNRTRLVPGSIQQVVVKNPTLVAETTQSYVILSAVVLHDWTRSADYSL
jgi:hypothetical protein